MRVGELVCVVGGVSYGLMQVVLMLFKDISLKSTKTFGFSRDVFAGNDGFAS